MTGDELYRTRFGLGLTQAELAEALMISEALVSRMEAGTRNISPRTARDLAKLVERSEGDGTELR